MMPPSPRLSARITRSRYLIEMTMIRAQKINDKMPSTLVRFTCDQGVAEEALAKRVERARADVAVDDAERHQTGRGERGVLRRRGSGRRRAGGGDPCRRLPNGHVGPAGGSGSDRDATVDDEHLAGRIRAFVAGEVDRDRGDLVGVPRRPIGCRAMKSRRAASGSSAAAIRWSRDGDCTVPGQIALQRTPRPTKSAATDLVSPITAALVVP